MMMKEIVMFVRMRWFVFVVEVKLDIVSIKRVVINVFVKVNRGMVRRLRKSFVCSKVRIVLKVLLEEIFSRCGLVRGLCVIVCSDVFMVVKLVLIIKVSNVCGKWMFYMIVVWFLDQVVLIRLGESLFSIIF